MAWRSGFRFWRIVLGGGLGFVLGVMVSESGSWVSILEVRVLGAGFRALGFRF